MAENISPTFVNCIFSNRKNINGCSILNDDVRCDPTVCMWRHTEETYFASLEKAMMNYIKRTGRRDYIDKCVFGITVKDRFRKYLKAKAKFQMLDIED